MTVLVGTKQVPVRPLHGFLEVYSVFPFWHARNGHKRDCTANRNKANMSPFAKIGPGRPARLDKIHPCVLRKECLKMS